MQSLNLSNDAKKSDGRLKSLFWPIIENAWDVDYLGQQGFWICLIIAILSFALISISTFGFGSPTARIGIFIIGAIVSFVYFVGGMGVRQGSWPAALSVFILYVIDHVSAGGGPNVISIILGAVLLSNVRATILASRWKPSSEGEDRPMRFNETFRDKLVDQLPPHAWPILKYPFYVLVVLVLMMLATSALRLRHPPLSNVHDENGAPSAAVSPSDSQ